MELERDGFPSVRISCNCRKLNRPTEAFVEAAQGGVYGRKLLTEVKHLRSTFVEGSGKVGHFAALQGISQTAVRALAPARWGHFQRPLSGILQLHPLPIAHVETHGAVAAQLEQEGLDLVSFFDQLEVTVQFLREVFETKTALLQADVGGITHGLLDTIRKALGSAPPGHL
jgi:hypothetical protein